MFIYLCACERKYGWNWDFKLDYSLPLQSGIYFGDTASFNNALDVHSMQGILVPLP